MPCKLGEPVEHIHACNRKDLHAHICKYVIMFTITRTCMYDDRYLCAEKDAQSEGCARPSMSINIKDQA